MQTSKPEYIPYLLESLDSLGEAKREQLLQETYRSMEPALYPADKAVLSTGVARWRNQAEYMLDGLLEEGVIKEKDGLLSRG